VNKPKAKNTAITRFVVFTKLQTLYFGLEDSITVHHHPPVFFNPKKNSNLGFPCTQHHHIDDKNSQNVKVTNYSLVSACCSHTSDGHPPDSFLVLPSPSSRLSMLLIQMLESKMQAQLCTLNLALIAGSPRTQNSHSSLSSS
jgi:hypothetical protein